MMKRHLSPKLKQAGYPYRNVAGNQFAAAAAAYWLARQVFEWGARGNFWGNDDWHADLFAGTLGLLMLPGLAPAEHERQANRCRPPILRPVLLGTERRGGAGSRPKAA